MFGIIYTSVATVSFLFILIGRLAEKPGRDVLYSIAIFGTNPIELIATVKGLPLLRLWLVLSQTNIGMKAMQFHC
jgi:hypothetical protein